MKESCKAKITGDTNIKAISDSNYVHVGCKDRI